MKLQIKFKAVKVQGATKASVMLQIVESKFHYTHTNKYVCFVDSFKEHSSRFKTNNNNTVARLFCIEKHRKKVERVVKQGKTVSSKILQKAHWVGHYYDVPVALIEASGIKVQQGNRTFKITQLGSSYDLKFK